MTTYLDCNATTPVDPRVIEHPLGIISLDACRLCRKQPRVERDAGLQIIDMQMDMKTFHD